ncbi:N-acetylglucosamine kinase isoform X2 [Megalopta genalis]|nr:N-acetyl-D-glucosamine kinase isoform X2 [Megalopta genalis]
MEDKLKIGKDPAEYAKEIRFGGVEGGGSHSTLILMDGVGTPLTEVEGPETNHWALGIDETAARIAAMVQRGKENIGMPESVPLDALGLCLSGCEEEESNRILANAMREHYPNTAKDYFIASDTVGALKTAFDNGGVVLIAGTGSNASMITNDGKTITCGGWGYMLGDEGSAYWIAHRACKYVFDDIDGLFPAPKPISYIWPALRTFFKVASREEILPHWYANFNKTKLANFTMEVVTGCKKEDLLSLHLMKEAGEILAEHVVALAKKAPRALKLANGGLKIICVGSVWKSWIYIKDSFLNKIHDSNALDELSLYHLTVSAAIGACYSAAEKINWAFPKPYNKNSEIFYHYRRENYVKPVEKIKSQPVLVPCNTASGN